MGGLCGAALASRATIGRDSSWKESAQVIIPMITRQAASAASSFAFGIMGIPPLGAAHMASPDGKPHLRQGADWGAAFMALATA